MKKKKKTEKRKKEEKKIHIIKVSNICSISLYRASVMKQRKSAF